MDSLREFLELIKRNGTAKGNLAGLLHILIGRRIALADGTAVSGGLTCARRGDATQVGPLGAGRGGRAWPGRRGTVAARSAAVLV